MPRDINRAIITSAITVGLALVAISVFGALALLVAPLPTHPSLYGEDLRSLRITQFGKLVYDCIQAALGVAIVYLGICMRNPKFGLPTSDDATKSIVSTEGFRLRGIGALALACFFLTWAAGGIAVLISIVRLTPQTRLALSHVAPAYYQMWSAISDAVQAAAGLCAAVALIYLAVRLLGAARTGARQTQAGGLPA